MIFKKCSFNINKMTERNNQLTSAIGYNTENMIFSEPLVGSIPSSGVPITFKRVVISTRNSDGSIGDLIIPVKGFSFGVSENKDMSGNANGYVFPICLHTRGAVTEEEKEWVSGFEEIVDACKDYLVENRETIQKYDLEKRDLKRLNPIYYKRVNGVIDENSSPVFYVKLITQTDKTTGEKIIKSMFFNSDDEKINPLDIVGKYCTANAALKVESIFIGNKISLQVKLYEAEVKLIQSGMKRLLRTATAPKRLINKVESHTTTYENEEEDDTGSIIDDDEDDEDYKPPEESKPKKVVKKVVKKVKKVRKVKKKST